jgi:hypothetical protein
VCALCGWKSVCALVCEGGLWRVLGEVTIHLVLFSRTDLQLFWTGEAVAAAARR